MHRHVKYAWLGREGPDGYPGISGEKGAPGETVFGPPGMEKYVYHQIIGLFF